MKLVMKLVRAIRNGWIKKKQEADSSASPRYYNLWKDESNEPSQILPSIPAPKMKLPGIFIDY